MNLTRTSLIFLALQFTCLVFAADDSTQSDKPSVFPVQKNSSDSGSSTQDGLATNQQFPSLSKADSQKPPKDTSLNLTGNGGSSNRSAGGNAMLKKRFTF